MRLLNWFIGFSLVAFMAGCACSPCPPCLPDPVGPVAGDIIVCRAGENPQIPERLQAKLFDTAVNTGVGRATRLLQESLNGLKPESALAVDGALGPKTRSALCGLSEEAILMVYVEKQSVFYQSIVQKNPSQAKFLKGWLRRAAWVPE